MSDKIELMGNTLVQHGNHNRRIYIISLSRNDFPEIIQSLELLAKKNEYSKIIARVPYWGWSKFEIEGFKLEAKVPKFFKGNTDLRFYSKYLEKSRGVVSSVERNIFDANIKKTKPLRPGRRLHQSSSFLNIRTLTEDNIPEMVSLYKENYKTYPFPIYETEYIASRIKKGVMYVGTFKNNVLAGVAAAEINEADQNACLTDTAFKKQITGPEIINDLFNMLLQELKNKNIKTVYSFCRSLSPNLNTGFRIMEFNFAGTLVNDFNIYGQIESVNVWTKQI